MSIVARRLKITVDSLVGLCMQEYKSLYAAVTICATLVDQKFDFLHFIPVHDLEKQVKPQVNLSVGVHVITLTVQIWWP